MVKPRPRKTDRGTIPQDLFETAAKEVIEENRSVRGTAKKYGMCHVSLFRYVASLKRNETPKVGYNPHNKVFTAEQEKQLCDYCEISAKLYFGLPPKQLRKLAYQYAKQLNCKFPEGWKTAQIASEDWLTCFLKRNSSLSIRQPESTSLARAMNFNRVNVNKFFDNLDAVMDRHKFCPNNIYNVDETGCTTVQKTSKIIATKGVKQVGGIVTQERGTLVTVCVAVNALGQSIPPMFIFPLKRYNEHFVRDGPPGCIGSGNKSGWMQEEDFLIFIKHFEKYAKPSEENKVLLILDNHSSHLFIPVIEFCRSHHITLLSFPPHTSHRLQPLDRGVFGPFKKFYNNECDQWMRSNPGKRLTVYNIPSLVKEAVLNAMTPKNITAGFRCTGIWPLNRNIFTDDEFEPSSVTDRPLSGIEEVNIGTIETNAGSPGPLNVNLSSSSTLEERTSFSEVSAALDEPQPSTSGVRLSTPPLQNEEIIPMPPPPTKSQCTPELIRPLPKADFNTKPKDTKRLKGKTAILTDTPEKDLLEQRYNQKLVSNAKKKVVGGRQTKKSVETVCKKKNRGRKRKLTKEDGTSSDDETICLVCCGAYKKSKEDWLQCRQCREWAHAKCANDDPLFVCNNCFSD